MRLLSTVRLNDNQKRVLAKIAAAPTPTVAGEEISKEPNLISARNLLMKLGAITFVDGRAEITDKGQSLGKDENILDDSGGLTDAGNKIAFTKANGQPEDGGQDGGQAPTGDIPPPAPGGDMSGDMAAGGEDDWGGEPADDEDVKIGGQEPLVQSFVPCVLLKQLLG